MFLSILFFNCNGLRNLKKRKEVFDYLNKMNYDIYCFQEIYFQGIEEIVEEKWDGICFFDSLINILGGVVILFREVDVVIVVEEKIVDEGRCFMIEFFIGEKRYFFCCIYGYNEDGLLEEFFN